MRQLTVETFPVTAVKDTLLPQEIVGFEVLPEVAREILAQCPVICDATSDVSQLSFNFDGSTSFGDPWGETPYYLGLATSKHVRSVMVRGGLADRHWQDEYGNFYGSLTLKGNNFSHAQLIETQTATERFIGYGLQESAIIERVLRASQLLREAGIATEYIVGLAEPKEFFLRHEGLAVRHQPVSLAEYKHYLTFKHWQDLPEPERTLEAYADIAKQQERSTYYVSLRATDTPYRFEDARNVQSAREQVFQLINELHGESLSVTSPADWEIYLTKYFLPRAVANLAKLHSIGLAHRHPNGMNVSALGAIVDLDSVHGETLGFGDEPIGLEDVARDIVVLGEIPDFSLQGMANKTVQDFAKDVVRLYFQEVDQLYTPEEAIDIKLALTSYLHEEFERSNAGKKGEFFASIARPDLLSQLVETVVDASLMPGLTERWLDEMGEDISEALRDRFMQELPQVANWLLFDEVLHNGGNIEGKVAKIVDSILNPNVRISAATDEHIFKTLLLDVIAPKYRDYIEAHLDDLVCGQYRENGRIDIIRKYLAEHLCEDFEDAGAIDVWLDAQIIKLLEAEKEKLNALAQPASLPYVFTNNDYCDGVVNSGNKVIRVTTGVGLPAVIKYAKQNEIEIVVKSPVVEDGPFSHLRSGLDHSVTDDADLIQVLSFAELGGWSPDYTHETDPLRVTKFEPDTLTQDDTLPHDYLVYVEQIKTGGLRFVVAFKDSAKSMAYGVLEGDDLVRSIEQDPLGSETLFDQAS